MNIANIASMSMKIMTLGGTLIPMFLKAASDGRITGVEIAEMVSAGARVLNVSFDVDWADGWDDQAGAYKEESNG